MSSAALLTQVSEDRISQHIAELQGVRHPTANPIGLQRAEAYIRAAFTEVGYRVVEHSFLEQGTVYRNLLATSPGTHQPEVRVLVLAHYDTVPESPGADDNASGVAVLLEAARVLYQQPLARTLQFVAVNLEESGNEPGATIARGSRALATHARSKGWQIEAVLNLEMVAYAGPDMPQQAPPGVPVAAPAIGNFICIAANERSAGVLGAIVEAIEAHRLPLPFVPLLVPGNGETLPDIRRSDHAPFWDAGYRAVMVTDTANFRNPHHHRPSDLLGTLNIAFAAQVCQVTVAALVALAGSDRYR